MLRGVPDVQADEVALPLDGFGGFVVQPDDRAEASGGVGGEGQGVAGGVAEAGGHLTVPGVEALLGEQVGLGDAVVPAGQSVEDPAVRQGAARHRLQVAQVRAAEAQADGRGGPAPVGGLQGDESAPGAHQGGSRAQQFVQGGVERAGADQSFGQFVQGGEVRDPAGEAVLEQRARGAVGVCRGGRGGTRGGRDSVCGGGNR